MDTSPRSSRRQLLINGRRVRISDLLDAGHLKAGETLFFEQRQGEPPHVATVVESGRLRLADGREFTTPSGAGSAASGLVAVPGWAVWRVGQTGPTLHELRRQLLQEVADTATPEDEAPQDDTDREAVRRRFAKLNEARERAESGDPMTMTVRELVRLWGLEDRERAANQEIEADLANHGLTTAPDFRAVSLDRVVKLVPPPSSEETAPAATSTGDESSTLQADLLEAGSAEIGLTLGNLLGPEDTLVSVTPSATLEEAITLMLLNDFSQLAVLTGNSRTLHGAVTWRSIAQAKHANPAATLGDAVVSAQAFAYDTRLLRVLNTLKSEEFIFVRDEHNKVAGIITAADVVHTYDETATPFFLIGEVDQELRRLIQVTFDEETIRRACASAGHNFRSFDSMTMGNYQVVLANPDCWQQLGWPLDRRVFTNRLDDIRKVRNTVMHFNPDPVRPADVAKLRHFLDLIRSFNK